MFLENLRVPIPEDSQVRKNGNVRHEINTVGGWIWAVIGKLPSSEPRWNEEGTHLMIPNLVYRRLFKAFYIRDVVQNDPDRFPPFFCERVRLGEFALFLGAVTKSGLYDLLIDVFGVETANALLDLAMLCNRTEHLGFRDMDYFLEDRLVFSVRPHSEDWYVRLIDGDAITEEKIQAFMQRWTKLRQESGPRDIAVHNTANGADWLEPSSDSLSTPWGVFAACETGGEYPGLPLAYHLYQGRMPKRPNMQEAVSFFQGLGLDPKRMIISKDICDGNYLAMCDELRLPWITMLKPYYAGYESMLHQHEEEMLQGSGTPITARLPVTAFCASDTPIFGPGTPGPERKAFVAFYCVTKEANKIRASFIPRLEKTYQEACTALDHLQDPSRKSRLPIPHSAEDAEKAAGAADAAGKGSAGSRKGRKPASTPEQKAASILYNTMCQEGELFYTPDNESWYCLKLEYHPEEQKYRCVIDQETAQSLRCQDSFFALASSEPMSPQELSDDLPLNYFLSSSIFEPSFSAMHSQLNTGTPGGRSFHAWFFVSFLSDIVRALLMPSFRQFETARDTEIREEELKNYTAEELAEEEPDIVPSLRQMIRWLDTVVLYRADKHFCYGGKTEGVRGAVLEAAGIQLNCLPYFSRLADVAEDPDEVQKLRQVRRTIPTPPKPRKRGRKQGKKSEEQSSTASGSTKASSP